MINNQPSRIIKLSTKEEWEWVVNPTKPEFDEIQSKIQKLYSEAISSDNNAWQLFEKSFAGCVITLITFTCIEHPVTDTVSIIGFGVFSFVALIALGRCAFNSEFAESLQEKIDQNQQASLNMYRMR